MHPSYRIPAVDASWSALRPTIYYIYPELSAVGDRLILANSAVERYAAISAKSPSWLSDQAPLLLTDTQRAVEPCPTLGEHDPVLGEYDPVLGEHDPVLVEYDPVLGEHNPVLVEHCQTSFEHCPVLVENGLVLV